MTDPIKVYGVKDALKVLNDVDKRFRRQLTKQFAEIVDPVVAEAQSYLPKPYDRANVPSGFFRNWNPIRARYKRGEHDGYVRQRRSGQRGSKPKFDVIGVPEWRSTEAIQTEHGLLNPIETHSWVFPWNEQRPKINPFLSGKKVRQVKSHSGGMFYQNMTAFGIRMTSHAAMLFDLANAGGLGKALTKKTGHTPSRIMWRAMDHNVHKVEANVARFLQHVIKEANYRLTYASRFERAVKGQ